MIKNTLAKVVFGSTFLTATVMPAIAMAQAEAGATQDARSRCCRRQVRRGWRRDVHLGDERRLRTGPDWCRGRGYARRASGGRYA